MTPDRRRPRPFTSRVRSAAQGAGAMPILDLHGEVDGFAAPELEGCFRAALAQRPAHIALNFGDVDYINSTGIALIVGLLAEARRADVALVGFGLSEHYAEIFRVTRLADYLPIVENEAAALETSAAARDARRGS